MADTWYKWDTGRWKRDIGVQQCSMAARGLWREMLDLMHDSPQRGYLLNADGTPMSCKELSRILRSRANHVSKWLLELQSNGVYSVTETGVIYSRKMCRDVAASERAAANGRRGGNPILVNQDPVKPGVKLETESETESDNTPLTPQGETAVPSKASRSAKPPTGDLMLEQLPETIRSQPMLDAWNDWAQYHRERRTALKPSTVKKQLKKLAGWGEAMSIASIEASISNGWTGLFEPKPDPFSPTAAPEPKTLPPGGNRSDDWRRKEFGDPNPPGDLPL